jgi:hypothetical protein
MPNRNKIRGDAYERAGRDFFRANGFPGAERTKAGYERDGGDLHLDPVIGMAPGVIGQSKDVVTPQWKEWIAKLREQIVNANAEVGFIIWRRRGIPDVGEHLVIMPAREFSMLLRRAGYGDPLPITDRCQRCGTQIDWVDCPTGGWWAHRDHPADDHDAVSATKEVVESIDDNGLWFAVGTAPKKRR